MGYESIIYVVNKIGTFHEDINLRYAEEIAKVDMRAIYPISDVLRKYPRTDCFIYADDGNTEITEDRYGKPLTEIPIPNLITIITDVMEVERGMGKETYRRYIPLLNLLKGFDLNEWEDLVALHYGY